MTVSTIGCVQIAKQHLSVSNTMNKFFIFIGRNLAAITAYMWAGLAVLNVIWDHNFMTAFYQFNLALAWALVHTYERSERRLIDEICGKRDSQ